MGLHPKVTAAALSGAVVALLASEAKRRGIILEPEEASALTVLFSAVAGWFMPSDGGTPEPPAP